MIPDNANKVPESRRRIQRHGTGGITPQAARHSRKDSLFALRLSAMACSSGSHKADSRGRCIGTPVIPAVGNFAVYSHGLQSVREYCLDQFGAVDHALRDARPSKQGSGIRDGRTRARNSIGSRTSNSASSSQCRCPRSASQRATHVFNF